MDTTSDSSRRRVLAGLGTALLTTSLAGCTGDSDADGSDGNDDGAEADDSGGTDGGETGDGFEEPDYGNWFDDVDNYESTVDETDSDEVSIMVGAGNGFAFDPPAVAVSPGTTVVWEWTGTGGSHNVVDDGSGFESDLMDGEGETFERTFEETGVTKYYCSPHRGAGMKGAVAVVE